MARLEELDLTKLTALCGDFSVHILTKLEGLRKGDRLTVRIKKEDRELLEAAISSIRDAGVAEPVEEGEEGDVFYIVLEKRR
ncbi:MAG TPA: hypothetical protein EYH50_02085 [Pyrodictium delaneyi]|uniref:Uncharacterized protein n=1 Tax=Pyrodictium delaneyi TaxID=1273541 RepID=A0A833E8J8_9CREN|nr:hypothetical protein [Pyrodictium delaneyi]